MNTARILSGIARGLYRGLVHVLWPVALMRLAFRARKDRGHRVRWQERLGFIPRQQRTTVWVHAVSVGEVRAGLPLIQALRAQYPHSSVLVSTTTLTGARQVQSALGDTAAHVYAPYDVPHMIERFLRRAQPRVLILMETEVWPHWLAACTHAQIPVVLANARLSERSARGYARLGPWMAEILGGITYIAAQSQADADRFLALGAPRVAVMGNLKYDLIIPESVRTEGLAFRRATLGAGRPVWIAASTHPSEDEWVLDVFATLRTRWPTALLVLVPRHPERFDTVAALCTSRGFRTTRRSAQQPCALETAVFLGDSMGELLLFYAASDIAFVGGSIVPVGGHNVLEPALLGKPVLFGPHMFNFTEASERLLAAQAAFCVNSVTECVTTLEALLVDATLREAVGERGQATVERHRGALNRLLGLVWEVIEME